MKRIPGGDQNDLRPAVRMVALIGNPNTGKSTLFNRLTGSRQRVGNYPGVTVAKTTGRLRLGGREVTVLDLPGVYSLAATSPDERIACEVLAGRRETAPDLVVCLVDGRQPARGLFLACQIADFGLPLVIVLNFQDEAEAQGIAVNAELLRHRLGVPVVPISARSGAGLVKLRRTMAAALLRPAGLTLPDWPPGVWRAMGVLRGALATNIRLRDPEVRRMLFDSDSAYFDLVGIPRGERAALLEKARAPLIQEGHHPLSIEALAFQAFGRRALEGVVSRVRPARQNLSRAVDAMLTHRVFGLVVFAILMVLIFQCIYTWSLPVMDGIDAGIGWVGAHLDRWLAATPLFRSLVCDGILAGVGGVVIFLPQIFLLFFFISLLEDTGYLARAAFLMDRLFGWCGLNGKSFLPLLSGYACAIPGILATRTIEDPNARLVTIFITPLMSCSARLPVYLLMVGAFIQPAWGGLAAALVLFGIQAVGLLVALPLAWGINRWVLKTPTQPFLMELPPYRLPVMKDVLWRMGRGGGEFLQRAGSIILGLSIVIWALLTFPRQEGATGDPESQAAQIEQSYLGQAGRAVAPVFAPAGFDWRITVGVLASFPAREMMVSTMGIIYRLGGEAADDGESLGRALREARWTEGPRTGQPVLTVATALAVMVFFALCMQCGATLAVITREAGLRYAVLSFVLQTALAWGGAVVVYQTVSLLLA